MAAGVRKTMSTAGGVRYACNRLRDRAFLTGLRDGTDHVETDRVRE